MVDEVVEGITQGSSGGECYGTYSGSTGSGAGYVNSCIHSGSNDYTSGNTVWYNYVAASAGAIKNSSASDTTGNINTATESICPKGWTLPTNKQISDNRNVTNFSPVLGGNYINGVLNNKSVHGAYWSSESYNSAVRYDLYYSGDGITNDGYARNHGIYIRCVSEEKDVSDLTYMQDMTPSILQELCVIVNVLRA